MISLLSSASILLPSFLLAAKLVAFADALLFNAPGNLYQSKAANLTVNAHVHCTKDESWLVSPAQDLIILYEQACQGAEYLARMELERHGLDTTFEFFDRNTRPRTRKPKIMLPRKYVVGKCLLFNIASPQLFSLGPNWSKDP